MATEKQLAALAKGREGRAKGAIRKDLSLKPETVEFLKRTGNMSEAVDKLILLAREGLIEHDGFLNPISGKGRLELLEIQITHNRQLKDELKSKDAHIRKLEEKLKSYNVDNRKSSENEDLQTINQQLEEINQNLKEDLIDLRSKLFTQTRVQAALEEKLKSYDADNRQLKAENEQLRLEKADLQFEAALIKTYQQSTKAIGKAIAKLKDLIAQPTAQGRIRKDELKFIKEILETAIEKNSNTLTK
ncbi:MAG TPA: hypothetical protein VK211_23780 [Kamptonema sp.]|nr:hypothetical protein [Kamptonema sp.]